VTEQLDARGNLSTFSWDAPTETSTMTDARGGTWVDKYASGVLVSQTDPLGNTIRYGFNTQLEVSGVIDARGYEIDTGYDDRGNLTSRLFYNPLFAVELYTYDGQNNMLTAQDRNGRTTTMTYDSAGNLMTVRGPAPVNALTTYAYDPAGTGLVVSVTNPRNKATTFGYDAQGNRIRTTSPLGSVTTTTYDSAGRMLTLVEPRGNVAGGNPSQYTTTFTYDAAGNVLTKSDPLGQITTSTYDQVGNKLMLVDANQHTTPYSYDSANHLTTVTDAAGKVTTYTYDLVGNLATRSDANNHLTTYAYDLARRLTSVTLPLNRVWSYGYDANGNRTKTVDPIGNATPVTTDGTTAFIYDLRNRLTGTTYSDGTAGVSYSYNNNDSRLTMTDGSGSTSYVYDTSNRLASVTRPGSLTIGYTYDAANNLLSRSPSGGTSTTFTYDNDGRVATATVLGLVTTYGYDVSGNETSATYPSANGYIETRTHDRAGRLTEVKNTKGVTILSKSTYVLDPTGNRLSNATTTGTTTYAYDAVDRLTEACFTTACTGSDNFRRYTYDFVGNRLTEVMAAGTTTYSYDALDQLSSTTGPSGTVNYTYDQDGNQLTAGASTFTHSLAGRMKTSSVGGITTTYSYDGDRTRVSASTGTQANKTTKYLWDPNGPLPLLAREMDGNNAMIREYQSGAELLSMRSGNSTYYFHHDGLGSVMNVSSSNGGTQWTYDYLPFGGVRTATKNSNQAPPNVMRFTGQYLDTTGLYHLRARQYDPVTGRFLATDPAAPALTDPFVATYVYVGSNPVIRIDPSGKCFGPLIFLAPACIGAAIGVGSYVVSTVGANMLNNATEGRDVFNDPLKGLNPVDAGISAVAGAVGGPISGIAYGPTRILSGAALGCATTFASQGAGGRTGDLFETAIGCVSGGVGSIINLPTQIASFVYGAVVATAQAIATYSAQRLGSSSGK